jgi:site-specific DNA-methyltransferase (adenine-specific)
VGLLASAGRSQASFFGGFRGYGALMWEIHQGDAIDFLSTIPVNTVDAVVTDPPYCSGSVSETSRTASKGQGLRSETVDRLGWFVGDNMGTAGLVFLLRTLAFEARRFVKPTGHFLCFCDWRMLPNLAPAIESAGWRYQNMIVWDKGHMGLGVGFRAQHELILHFTAGAPEYHDKSTGNVITCKRIHHSVRQHQTQKPEDLLQSLIRVVCQKGGLVFDPFMGSGSVGVAALRNDCRFLGIEQQENHFDTARRRLWAEHPLYDTDGPV